MNKYDINKAYLEVMNVIQQIKDAGIKVDMSSNESPNEDLVKKYRDRLLPELWKHVTFYPVTNLQKDLIYQHSIRLSEIGILFDTGQSFGGIDWEIDWSLRIEKDQDYINDSIETKKLIKDVTSDHFPLPNVH